MAFRLTKKVLRGTGRLVGKIGIGGINVRNLGNLYLASKGKVNMGTVRSATQVFKTSNTLAKKGVKTTGKLFKGKGKKKPTNYSKRNKNGDTKQYKEGKVGIFNKFGQSISKFVSGFKKTPEQKEIANNKKFSKKIGKKLSNKEVNNFFAVDFGELTDEKYNEIFDLAWDKVIPKFIGELEEKAHKNEFNVDTERLENAIDDILEDIIERRYSSIDRHSYETQELVILTELQNAEFLKDSDSLAQLFKPIRLTYAEIDVVLYEIAEKCNQYGILSDPSEIGALFEKFVETRTLIKQKVFELSEGNDYEKFASNIHKLVEDNFDVFYQTSLKNLVEITSEELMSAFYKSFNIMITKVSEFNLKDFNEDTYFENVITPNVDFLEKNAKNEVSQGMVKEKLGERVIAYIKHLYKDKPLPFGDIFPNEDVLDELNGEIAKYITKNYGDLIPNVQEFVEGLYGQEDFLNESNLFIPYYMDLTYAKYKENVLKSLPNIFKIIDKNLELMKKNEVENYLRTIFETDNNLLFEDFYEEYIDMYMEYFDDKVAKFVDFKLIDIVSIIEESYNNINKKPYFEEIIKETTSRTLKTDYSNSEEKLKYFRNIFSISMHTRKLRLELDDKVENTKHNLTFKLSKGFRNEMFEQYTEDITKFKLKLKRSNTTEIFKTEESVFNLYDFEMPFNITKNYYPNENTKDEIKAMYNEIDYLTNRDVFLNNFFEKVNSDIYLYNDEIKDFLSDINTKLEKLKMEKVFELEMNQKPLNYNSMLDVIHKAVIKNKLEKELSFELIQDLMVDYIENKLVFNVNIPVPEYRNIITLIFNELYNKYVEHDKNLDSSALAISVEEAVDIKLNLFTAIKTDLIDFDYLFGLKGSKDFVGDNFINAIELSNVATQNKLPKEYIDNNTDSINRLRNLISKIIETLGKDLSKSLMDKKDTDKQKVISTELIIAKSMDEVSLKRFSRLNALIPKINNEFKNNEKLNIELKSFTENGLPRVKVMLNGKAIVEFNSKFVKYNYSNETKFILPQEIESIDDLKLKILFGIYENGSKLSKKTVQSFDLYIKFGCDLRLKMK